MDENKNETKKKKSRRLTEDEQIARINRQIAKFDEMQKALAARKRAAKARGSAKERQARAHRLIQIGGVIEAVYGAPVTGELMLKALENFLREQDRRGNYFSAALREAENIQRRQAAAEDSLPAAENEEADNNGDEAVSYS